MQRKCITCTYSPEALNCNFKQWKGFPSFQGLIFSWSAKRYFVTKALCTRCKVKTLTSRTKK